MLFCFSHVYSSTLLIWKAPGNAFDHVGRPQVCGRLAFDYTTARKPLCQLHSILPAENTPISYSLSTFSHYWCFCSPRCWWQPRTASSQAEELSTSRWWRRPWRWALTDPLKSSSTAGPTWWGSLTDAAGICIQHWQDDGTCSFLKYTKGLHLCI